MNKCYEHHLTKIKVSLQKCYKKKIYIGDATEGLKSSKMHPLVKKCLTFLVNVFVIIFLAKKIEK